MSKSKTAIIICIGLVIVIIICAIPFVFNNISERTEPADTTADDTIVIEPDYRFEHIQGQPVIEFDEGNEKYLDPSIVPYLERMEFGVPAIDENGNYYIDADGDIVYDMSDEQNLEWVLDNLITLINHFAKEEYSMDANHQIQRFYVMYYDRLTDLSYDELVSKLTECFPTGGADADMLGDMVLNVFGISSGDDCAFVFSPIEVAEIKVEFYNVVPEEVTITDEAEVLCIYDNWRNEEDDGYERNLEGWLHNVIFAAQENGFDDEKTIVAQILYAGSLANAEYRSDWEDSLIRCMTIEDMSYDNLKLAVENEFGVCIDSNVPLMDYFDAKNAEGGI